MLTLTLRGWLLFLDSLLTFAAYLIHPQNTAEQVIVQDTVKGQYCHQYSNLCYTESNMRE